MKIAESKAALQRRLARYPVDWDEVVARLRERAEGRCECVDECGLHPWGRCVERQGRKAFFAKGKIVLTTAHLNAAGGPCRCEPLCGNPDHLKQMCQRCHLRYDAPMHVQNARKTLDAKRGQLPLITEGITPHAISKRRS